MNSTSKTFKLRSTEARGRNGDFRGDEVLVHAYSNPNSNIIKESVTLRVYSKRRGYSPPIELFFTGVDGTEDLTDLITTLSAALGFIRQERYNNG